MSFRLACLTFFVAAILASFPAVPQEVPRNEGFEIPPSGHESDPADPAAQKSVVEDEADLMDAEEAPETSGSLESLSFDSSGVWPDVRNWWEVNAGTYAGRARPRGAELEREELGASVEGTIPVYCDGKARREFLRPPLVLDGGLWFHPSRAPAIAADLQARIG